MTDALSIFRNPPVRLSIEDSDYDPAIGKAIEVWFNGYKQPKVIGYDCEKGTITRYVATGFGELVIEDEEAKTETLQGEVLVRWKHRPS